MIKKRALFQVESNDEYYVIRITADIRGWKFIPSDLVQAIEKAKKEMEEQGLKPAPFGTEVV
jgi:hypothetical protein